MKRLWMLVCVLRLLATGTAFILGFFGEFRNAGLLSPWEVGLPVLAYAVFGPIVQWRSGRIAPSVSVSIADTVVGLTAVALSGAWQSPYFLILISGVVSGSLSIRLPDSMILSLAIAGAYATVAALSVSHGVDGKIIDVITDNSAILIVTALVAGTLNQQWRNESFRRRQEQRLARRLGILNRLLSETFPVSLDQGSAMRTVVDLAREAMASDIAGVFVRGDNGWHLWFSPDGSDPRTLPDVPLDETRLSVVQVHQFEDVNMSDYAAPIWNEFRIKGLAIAPISVSERIFGYLFVGHKTAYAFSDEECHLLTAICHHVGLGARNADLYALERERVQRLREIERLKTDFFNNVSHDLLTPLGAVTTASGLLLSDRDSRLSPQAASLLSNIERNAERLEVMVKDLLEIARIRSGRVTLKRTAIVPESLAQEAVEAVTPQFTAKGQRLELTVKQDIPTVWADHDRLERVLINLLQNAHNHTPEGGTISVVVDRPNGHVRFAVHDTGPGILPEQQGRVFERFYRPEGSEERSGSGLGLSIAKTLVELHGGRISVESSPGSGANFVVEVPLNNELDDEDSDC